MTISFTNCMWTYLLDMPTNFRAPGPLRRNMLGTKATYGRSEWDEEFGEVYYVDYNDNIGADIPFTRPGLGYPARVFVCGQTDDLDPVPRKTLLAVLDKLGIRTWGGAWEACLPFTHYDRESGKPVFDQALRADANLGIRMYDVHSALLTLPPGYEIKPVHINKRTYDKVEIWAPEI